jgi:hypothetical protein
VSTSTISRIKDQTGEEQHIYVVVTLHLSIPLCKLNIYTAKTQYRKFETDIPRKGIAQPRCSVLIFTFMFLLAIYILPQTVCLFGCRKIGGPIMGIYKYKHECGNWDCGRAIPCLGIHKWGFCCSEIARKVIKAFLKTDRFLWCYGPPFN